MQIQKIRNVSAPKANEESQAAPRMLKLTLTDGHNFCQAIEILPISSLSCDRTPPGSKILIKNARVVSGYIMLQPNNVSYLGGKVPALYEKWELSKDALKNSRRSCKFIILTIHNSIVCGRKLKLSVHKHSCYNN